MKNLFCIFLGITLIACGAKDSKKGNSSDDHTLLISRIDSLFNSYFDHQTPGVAVLITYDGKKVLSKGYGMRNIGKNQPITATTNLRSGSLAKQFTALGILHLVEEGKLKLTDTVYQYLSYPVFKDVTITQLLGHLSGIFDVEYVIEDVWESPDYPTNKDAIAWYSRNDTLRFTPGSKFEYNNGGYYILAKIIEIVSEKPFREYMAQEIFEPTGMSSTTFIDMSKSQTIEEKALCYVRDSMQIWHPMKEFVLDDLVGAGGIYTNLEDYYRYTEALRKNKILTPDMHDLIFKPITNDIELHSMDMTVLKNKNSGYAMGWEVFEDMAVSAGLYNGVNNWSIFEFNRPLTIVLFANNDLLFEKRLVDQSYDIINDYFTRYCAQSQ